MAVVGSIVVELKHADVRVRPSIAVGDRVRQDANADS
jgi:hypothetical protein